MNDITMLQVSLFFQLHNTCNFVFAVEVVSDTKLSIGDIPEAPEISSFVEEASKIVLNAAGEPTFASIGLGSAWTPAGWVQTSLEFLHCTVGMPWWAAILTG